MSEVIVPEEKNDDRYVAIAAKIRVAGDKKREEIFQAIEADDVSRAVSLFDGILALDRLYMLAVQKGLQIAEKNKPQPKPMSGTELAVAQQNVDAALSERKKKR